MTNFDVTKHEPASVPQMGAIAGGVRMALGSDLLSELDTANKVLPTLRDYFAPAALDVGYQNAARSQGKAHGAASGQISGEV